MQEHMIEPALEEFSDHHHDIFNHCRICYQSYKIVFYCHSHNICGRGLCFSRLLYKPRWASRM